MLSPGDRLASYTIVSPLGAGGMGEVYRARDGKLGRDVALKVLPSGLLADEEARRRFRKEAEALSRLSHPHLATLLDFDTAEGIDFLVMERVLGPTLEEELRKGPLAEKDVLRLGCQLARGLSAAHERGVVHRDLKPSNLQLTADGLLKILDFGVARLERAGSEASGETATETAPGELLGSPPYMAPEQVLGKGVDARTDVYAAGACLYELATGKRPFGERRGAVLTEAILHAPVAPPTSVNAALSPGLESMILKCLDKEPALRYQTAKELLVDLERLQAGATSSSGFAQRGDGTRRRAWRWATAALAVGGVLAAAGWLVRPPRAPRIVDVRPLTAGQGAVLPPAPQQTLATDGGRVYYIARSGGHIALLQVPAVGGEPIEISLPLTLNVEVHGFLRSESALLMSGVPAQSVLGDLQVAADQSAMGSGAPLWIVPVPGGSPRPLPLPAQFAAPSPDGERLVLVSGERLLLAARDGSGLREVRRLAAGLLSLAWAPDGRRIRFSARRSGALGPWIWETSVDGEEPRPLWPGQGGEWTADGRLFVFQRADPSGRLDLYAVVEEGRWLATQSTPARLTSGPLSFEAVRASPDEHRLFAWGAMPKGELTRYDADRGRFEPYMAGASIEYLDVSRDGKWLVWSTWPQGALWRSRADGRERRQLTAPGVWAALPRWSPDGRRIAFVAASGAGRPLSVSVVSADGGALRELSAPSAGTFHWDVCWLGDESVVFSHYHAAYPGLLRANVRTGEVAPWPGAEELQYPKCGPHGEVLATRSLREVGAARFSLFTPAAGTWADLDPPPPAIWPSFTVDGRAIIGLRRDPLRVVRYDLASRASQVVVDVSDQTLALGGAVPWMGLAPDGSPLVLVDRSSSDIYALDWVD
jgi:hypothetical protein